MAKKSMKEAAAAGTSVFDTIATGAQYGDTAQDAKDVQDVQNARHAQGVGSGRPAKYAQPLERLNLKIPTDIKDYLYEAAYRESSPRKPVSVTEYLIQLVREDMERHKGE